MKEYKFKIDQKVTVWDRAHYTVIAKDKKRALELIKEEFESPEYNQGNLSDEGVVFEENETLYDTASDLIVKNNNGYYTRELIDDSNQKSIKVNGKI